MSRRANWLVLAVALATGLAGCGGGSSGGGAAPGGGAGGGGGGGGGGNPVSGLAARPANSTCVAPAAPTPASGVALTAAFPNLPGLSMPVALLQAPGNSARWYVVEQGGRVRSFANDPAASSLSLVLDISGQVVLGAESGLLGMAFAPDFATSGLVYLSYTGPGTGGAALTSYISRFKSNDGGLTIDPASEDIVLSLAQPFANHNGGNIAFGPDGFLYIGFGDGGSANDPDGNGQNTGTWLGAMLRIDVSTPPFSTPPYGIPAGNAFPGGSCAAGTCPEIYAWGLRNPWRWSFDSASGKLWAGDVGQNTWEEIDRIEVGRNYGWNRCEGAHPLGGGAGTACNDPALVDPVAEYGTGVQGRCAVTGGYVYRGSTIPSLQGTLFYGDFCTGDVWGLDTTQAGATPQLLIPASGRNISSFAQDAGGEVYVLDYGSGGPDGGVYRIDPRGGGSTVPSQLSATGCVSATDPTQPADGLIPYDINALFWSDGAQKERFLALPDTAFIDIDPDDDWSFPVGTVLMKHFRLGGRLIETRLLMRHTDGSWAGYSYEWNAAGTDATLVPGGKTRTINGQQWIYPSGGECLRCHTAAAGRVLGPETAQMNRDFTYPSTGITANQLTTFEAIGLFSAPLAADPANLPALLDPYGGGDRSGRARAWLHTNCAYCHRPNGPTPASINLDYRAPVANMNLCNAVPLHGDLGINGARLVTPGDHRLSLLWERMQRRDSFGMPPLGSTLIDTAGRQLLLDWIDAMNQNCL